MNYIKEELYVLHDIFFIYSAYLYFQSPFVCSGWLSQKESLCLFYIYSYSTSLSVTWSCFNFQYKNCVIGPMPIQTVNLKYFNKLKYIL